MNPLANRIRLDEPGMSRNHRKGFRCWGIVVCLCFAGCTATSVFEPEQLYHASDQDITVCTTDGRVIEFESGSYQVSNSDPGIIRGSGRLVINKARGEWKAFDGSVGFQEIRNISTTEMTAAGKIALAGWIAAFAIGLYFYFFPPHFNAGG